ncbi:MAG: hypothetical protein ABI589_01470 [Burkholderiales bacterium]
MKRFLLIPLAAWMAGAMAPAALAETTIVQNPGSGANRIEVTGNSARNVQVRCAEEGEQPTAGGANVNSVNIDRRALSGKTVIVTGRNTQDVTSRVDCSKGDGARGQVNVNSVNIR